MASSVIKFLVHQICDPWKSNTCRETGSIRFFSGHQVPIIELGLVSWDWISLPCLFIKCIFIRGLPGARDFASQGMSLERPVFYSQWALSQVQANKIRQTWKCSSRVQGGSLSRSNLSSSEWVQGRTSERKGSLHWAVNNKWGCPRWGSNGPGSCLRHSPLSPGRGGQAGQPGRRWEDEIGCQGLPRSQEFRWITESHVSLSYMRHVYLSYTEKPAEKEDPDLEEISGKAPQALHGSFWRRDSKIFGGIVVIINDRLFPEDGYEVSQPEERNFPLGELSPSQLPIFDVDTF